MFRGDKLSEKRYYWIKLKTNFFEQETIDFLMSQKNGCQYIVLYQMLCLKTANTDGKLISKVGEMIVPYDINKIVRNTKYFDFDTVTVALELFSRLGLIYTENEDKTLQIANFSEMVGSETSSAQRVREHRQRKKALQCNNNVTQENRDKILENRNKNINITTSIRQNIDWQKYTEEEQTKPYWQYSFLTTAEYYELCEHINNGEVLDRYLLKVQNYNCKDPFETICQWAQVDGNYI